MPGYSGTPLPKKLGIKAGFRVQLADAPAEVRAELSEALADCSIVKQGDALDFVMVFTQSRTQLTKEFSRLAKRLAPAWLASALRVALLGSSSKRKAWCTSITPRRRSSPR